MSKSIPVEIAYALPSQQIILKLQVVEGTTAEQGVIASGIMQKFPEIDLNQNKIGIFGKLVKSDTVLREKDRVEIYHPLIADAKEVRKQRDTEGKVMKKGGGDVVAE